MDACTCGESRWSVGRMRSDGTGGVGTSRSGESRGVGDVCNWRLQKFANVSARPLAHWCAFGEEEEMEPWMNSISERINCSDWCSAPKHQKRHKVAQVKTGQIHCPGFASLSFRLKRNSCARSLRGQYARMGPLQYLFLCGLLYTKTDGKLTKKAMFVMV